MSVHAHTPRGASAPDPEPLADHLAGVAAAAEGFGAAFGWGAVAGLAGRLHDIGKCSAEFQAYLAGAGTSGGDHSGAGAIEARRLGLAPQLGHALAAVIAGHHAGLADGTELIERLGRLVPAYSGWRAQTGPLPPPAALAPARVPRMSPEAGFTGAFLTRMLFSCLVDADSTETARFYGEAERTPFAPVETLRGRLDAHLDALAAAAPATALNALRAEVLAHARGRAELPPGLFTLTVPTGGGKTLTALSFALRHAVRHGLQRVVTVIPFAGAWIETGRGAPIRPSRSSPLRGGVDRNGGGSGGGLFGSVAPSRGCGSKPCTALMNDFSGRSPLRGSVDRNVPEAAPKPPEGGRPFEGAWIKTCSRSRGDGEARVAPSRGRGSKRHHRRGRRGGRRSPLRGGVDRDIASLLRHPRPFLSHTYPRSLSSSARLRSAPQA